MIDRAEIHVKAGDGGNGAVSFRREKYVPFGGPDGGDGGNGGSVYLVANSQLSSLHTLSRRRHWKAERGGDGGGRKMHGRKGADLMIEVPAGTVVYRSQDDGTEELADLSEDGRAKVVAHGGRGGRGNARFATATNQAPRIAEKGDVGEEVHLLLDLKLIADVGIVGYPSVGKSTLLAAASAARPKIAEYPFTTTEPALGVVEVGRDTFVLAEIPGLIEGAHTGVGLGDEFLRHAERTRVLIHLVDGTTTSVVHDIAAVNQELQLYNEALGRRPQILAVNKIDLPEVEGRMRELRETLSREGQKVMFVSAATGRGVAELMAKAAEMLQRVAGESTAAPAKVVLQPPSVRPAVSVREEGGVFVVSCEDAERLVARMDLASTEARSYVRRQLGRLGVAQALRRAGAKPGDRIRVADTELEWQ
ncbi:MAG: GTPase ObgE [Chloroflexota bacterium]|nr:GTPase ObgE [Chloroflexota bacterium]